MAQRMGQKKDFYQELGVSSDASPERIKRAYRKLARDLHPDREPGQPKPPANGSRRFRRRITCWRIRPKRKSTTKPPPAAGSALGSTAARGRVRRFRGRWRRRQDSTSTTCSTPAGGTIGDLFGGLFGRGGSARPSARQRPETELDFVEAAKGVAIPLRLTSRRRAPTAMAAARQAPASVSHATGRVISNQGAFGFSEPCTDCQVAARSSSTLRSAKGTGTNHQRADPARCQRMAHPGPSRSGASRVARRSLGDLRRLHVRPDKIFGRDGDDLTKSPFRSASPNWLWARLSVPTLDTVGVRCKGTADGHILRVRGRGVPKRSGAATCHRGWPCRPIGERRSGSSGSLCGGGQSVVSTRGRMGR